MEFPPFPTRFFGKRFADPSACLTPSSGITSSGLSKSAYLPLFPGPSLPRILCCSLLPILCILFRFRAFTLLNRPPLRASGFNVTVPGPVYGVVPLPALPFRSFVNTPLLSFVPLSFMSFGPSAYSCFQNATSAPPLLPDAGCGPLEFFDAQVFSHGRTLFFMPPLQL